MRNGYPRGSSPLQGENLRQLRLENLKFNFKKDFR